MITTEEVFALNVRARLESLGLTQRDLAKKIGMSENGLSVILNGGSSRRKNQLAIAEALGCTREELLATREASDYVSHLTQVLEMGKAAAKIYGKVDPRVIEFFSNLSNEEQAEVLSIAQNYHSASPSKRTSSQLTRARRTRKT